MTDPAIPTPEQIRKMPVNDVKTLRKALVQNGLTVVQGRAHLRVETSGGAFVGTLPLSPSCPHALRNCRAWLARRVGELGGERGAGDG